ncbi:MAG: helix-turn-helix transcriptional regulator, partial [Clostridia bacterium]|nr:helix-turn-helix transcriptional regulator [Clostridia bacterium]
HRTDDIGRCHAESVRALRLNTLFGEKTSVTSSRSYYVPDYNRFSILLSNGEIDKLKAVIHETLDSTAINSPSGSVSAFALACNELLLMLCKALHERGIDVSAYFPAGNLHLLFPDNLTQLKDVRRWFDTILDEASKQLDTRTKQAVSHLILNICRFVETHYAEPINNSIIADKFGYSPNYLGKIFREETDTNLNDYIKDIRIEKAKSLLSETSLRIADIAVQTGFSDSQYFSVVFRQKTGCTPKEYREMHK